MQYVAFLCDFSQITSNHQSNTNTIFRDMIFLNIEFIKFQGIPGNSMELQKISREFNGSRGTFGGKIYSSIEFHGIAWNSGVWHVSGEL